MLFQEIFWSLIVFKTNFFLFSSLAYLVFLLIFSSVFIGMYPTEYEMLNYLYKYSVAATFFLLTTFFIVINGIFARFSHKGHQVSINTDHNEAANKTADQRRVAALVEMFQEGVLIFDQEGEMIICNHIAQSMLGIQFSYQNPISLFKLARKQKESLIDLCLKLGLKALRSESVIKEAITIEHAKTKNLTLIASPSTLESYIIVIIQDNSSLNRISQLGKDFIANASHELRTPITIIKGFAETLRDLPVVSESMLEDITERIIRSCERVNNLVQNLLLLADLDHSVQFDLRPCDLVSLFESCSYSLLALHPDICIEVLQNQDEIMVPANPDLLEQAIMNLLENAVKYSKTTAHITVTMKQEGSKVSIEIRDRGIGIDQEHLEHIFDRFYRENKDRSRKLGGAGLGLSIVYAIIEKHHGEICVESKKDVGTTFIITLDTALQSQQNLQLASLESVYVK